MSLKKLYLELSDRCNLNCNICYRQSFTDTPRDLDQELYARLIEDLKSIPTLETIVLGGIGEPTCAPNFVQVLKDLKNYQLILTTNGVDLPEVVLEAIVSYVSVVVISIDGMDDIFEKIRGVELRSVTETVNRLQKLKKSINNNTLQINLQCVLSKDNQDDALKLVDLAANLKVDGLIFSNLLPQLAENRDKILYTRYENKPMKLLYDALVIRSIRRGLKLTLAHRELKSERFCSFIEEESTFINADGDVIPCYRLSHGYKEYIFGREKQVLKHSFGNLKEKTLLSVWEGEQYTHYRDRVRNNRYPSCIDCDLVDGCAYVVDTTDDCWGGTPSCSDCLWSRRIIICP
jgi:tungsten cofactor oxidoreducase radical SAM maturase